MISTTHARGRSESGFTLIELLVVMIIIAILMAVAIPTFLAQKNTAQKTKATSNIEQIKNAIEACATNNTDSGYTGCLDSAALTTFEKGLTSLTFGTAGIGAYQITPSAGASPQGYVIATAIKDGDQTVFFSEIHTEAGTVIKGCGLAALTITSPAPTAGVSGSRTCTNGRWG